jgi:hypothetical protein
VELRQSPLASAHPYLASVVHEVVRVAEQVTLLSLFFSIKKDI